LGSFRYFEANLRRGKCRFSFARDCGFAWLWISEEFRCIQIVLAGDADQGEKGVTAGVGNAFRQGQMMHPTVAFLSVTRYNS